MPWPALPDWDALDVGAAGGLSFDGSWTVVEGAGIRSLNWSAGSSGWSIKADGSAEFNDVTVRGTIDATSGEISGTLTMGVDGEIVMQGATQDLRIRDGGIFLGNINDGFPVAIFPTSSGLMFYGDGSGGSRVVFHDFTEMVLAPSVQSAPSFPLKLYSNDDYDGGLYIYGPYSGETPVVRAFLSHQWLGPTLQFNNSTGGVSGRIYGDGAFNIETGTSSNAVDMFIRAGTFGGFGGAIYMGAGEFISVWAGAYFDITSGELRAGDLVFDRYQNYTGGGAAGGAEISNDNGAYQALMILGNNSAGGNRIVKMWDDVIVNGALTTAGNVLIGSGQVFQWTGTGEYIGRSASTVSVYAAGLEVYRFNSTQNYSFRNLEVQQGDPFLRLHDPGVVWHQLQAGPAGTANLRFSSNTTPITMDLTHDGNLYVNKYIYASNATVVVNPATTGSSPNAQLQAWGGGYALQRFTSARKYKRDIDYQVDYLADIRLRPNIHWRIDEKRYRYGFIAEDIADQLPPAGVYDEREDGSIELENFDQSSVLAILAAKVNRLESLLSV